MPTNLPMSQPSGLLKIGAFAKLAGTNLRTLRYYEEVGLLRPAARSGGGFRYYRETDLNRIQLIRDLQELGLTLEEIRGLLEQRGDDGTGSTSIERIYAALVTHKGLLDARLERLESQRSSVREAVEKLAQCTTCDIRPGPDNNYCEPCQKTGADLPSLLSGLF
jgi:DNA-binding transcriptional MerR regulator